MRDHVKSFGAALLLVGVILLGVGTSLAQGRASGQEVEALLTEGYELLEAGEDDRAKKLFEQALRLDPNSASARNGLGVYHLSQGEHWFTILESLRTLLGEDHLSRAIEEFETALRIDPEYPDARYNLALTYRKKGGDDDLRQAAHALEQLVALRPGFRDARYLLGRTYKELGAFNQAEGVFSRMLDSGEGSPAGAHLGLAEVLFVQGEPVEGGRHYWQGLMKLGDRADARPYFEDVELISSDAEREQWETLAVEEIEPFFVRFWERRAQQSLVDRDERIAEHYRRLQYAWEHYRIPVPQRRHYSGKTAYRPSEQSGFDDRGVIYVRHGEPDKVARHGSAAVELNESWLYFRPGEDLIFHFVADEDTKDFKLVRRLMDALIATSNTLTGIEANSDYIESLQRAVQQLYESRSDFSPLYGRMASHPEQRLVEEELVARGRDIEVGTATDTYVPDIEPATRLEFHYVPVTFRGDDGKTDVVFLFGVPTANVEFQWSARGLLSDLNTRIALYDPERRPITEADRTVQLVSRKPVPQSLAHLIVSSQRLEAGWGRYQYAIRIANPQSGRHGVYYGQVRVPDYEANRLQLSDVVLAESINPSGEEGSFRRRGVGIVPLPSRAFKREQPVGIYYEIYNLKANQGGRTRYRIEYTVTRKGAGSVVLKVLSDLKRLVSQHEGAGEITFSMEKEGTRADGLQQEYLTFDMSDAAPGEYQLHVRVTDFVADEDAFALTPFTVAESAPPPAP